MTDKIITIVYDRGGEALKTENLTDEEQLEAESMVEEGIRDVGKIRQKLGIEPPKE